MGLAANSTRQKTVRKSVLLLPGRLSLITCETAVMVFHTAQVHWMTQLSLD